MVWNITVGPYCSSFCILLFSITFSFKILSKIFVKFLFWNNHRFARSCKNSMIPYTRHPVSVKWMLLTTVHQSQEIGTCEYRSMPSYHTCRFIQPWPQSRYRSREHLRSCLLTCHQFHSNSYKNFFKKIQTYFITTKTSLLLPLYSHTPISLLQPHKP